MSAWKLHFFVSLLFFTGKGASTSNITPVLNQSCRTTANEQGRCVPIEQCPFIHQILGKTADGNESIADHKKICGLQGISSAVCCPSTIEEHPNIGLVRKHPCGDHPPIDRVYYFVYPGDYASAALLLLEGANSPRVFCGGNLINDRYVLTAASCLEEDPEGVRMFVRLGEHNLSIEPDCNDEGDCADPVQNFGIEEIRRYVSNVDVEGSSADLALIRLNGTAKITKFVSPICLPSGDLLNEEFVGQQLLVPGWGITNNGTGNNQTQVILFKVTNCTGEEPSYLTEETSFCIEGRERGDFCTSDRGGGIMTLTFHQPRSLIKYLIGVAAAGSDCDRLHPRVYTRVGPFVNWILSNMRL